MIRFTGHQLDAVVVPDRRPGRDRRSGCCSAPRSRAAPTTPRTSSAAARRSTLEQTEPLIDVYRDARHRARDRRHRRGRRGHPAHLRRAATSSRRADRSAPLMGLLDRGIEIKTPEQIAAMRAAGLRRRRRPSSCCAAHVRAGVIDRRARRASPRTTSASAGATPVVPGLPRLPGLDLRVGQRRGRARHPGRPGARRRRRDLDRLRRDRRRLARRRGDHGRRRRRSPAEVTELMRVTEESMWRGIAAARLGGRVTDISHAVERYVRGQGGYGIVEDYTGHGIGSEMHQPPNVPNFGRPGQGPRLVRGLALAVEPMITLGSKETDLLDDEWTVVTDRRQLGRALRAHVHAHPRRAPGCSPRSTAASSSSPSWACGSAVAEPCDRMGSAGGSIPSLRVRQHDEAPGPQVVVGGGRDL